MSVEDVLSLVSQAEWRHSRLVLVVGPGGAGKTTLLRAVSESLEAPLINVGRDLAERLLSIAARDRPLEVARQMDAILPAAGPVLLDNTELLFEPSLQQDPLQLLRALSRNRLVVAAWRGRAEGGQLTNALFSHPAARRFPAADILIVPLSHRS